MTFISIDDKINDVVAKKQIEDNKKDKKSCWHEKRNVLIYSTLQKQQLTHRFEVEKKKIKKVLDKQNGMRYNK